MGLFARGIDHVYAHRHRSAATITSALMNEPFRTSLDIGVSEYYAISHNQRKPSFGKENKKRVVCDVSSPCDVEG